MRVIVGERSGLAVQLHHDAYVPVTLAHVVVADEVPAAANRHPVARELADGARARVESLRLDFCRLAHLLSPASAERCASSVSMYL